MSYTHLGFFANTTMNRIVPICFVLPKKAKSSTATYAVAACRLLAFLWRTLQVWMELNETYIFGQDKKIEVKD